MDNPQNANQDVLSKLLSAIEVLSSKVDALNESVDYMKSLTGSEEGPQEPPGQLAGISMNALDQLLPAQKATTVRAYVLRVLALFKKYIKSVVLFGSAKRKEDYGPRSDIDIAFIVDPSDVTNMSLAELRDKLFGKLVEMASAYSDLIHPQGYTLLDIWQGIIKPDPVILTLLRDGIAIYDTGFFYPLQTLYKAGQIVPNLQSIDSLVSNAEFMLTWAQSTLRDKLANDLFLSVVDIAQALLMELGYMPPTPKEIPKALYEVAVTKEKLLAPEDVRNAEEVINWWKKIEHQEIAAITGKEYDEHFKLALEFVQKLTNIISELRKKAGLPPPTIVEKKPENEQSNYQQKQ